MIRCQGKFGGIGSPMSTLPSAGIGLVWEQVLRSTGLCSTIQIKEKLFDDLQKLWCSTRIKFEVEAAIVEH